nr:hypothetical protein [Tanacetum cinerariifolium]
MAGFHHLDDTREIWLAVEAQFGGNKESKKMRKTMLKQEFSEFSVSEEEGSHKWYDRFQKILSQLNQMQAKPDNDDVNLKFLRALPLSWSQVALTLKTRGGLEYLSFDDLYNKLRSLKIDVKGGSSYGSRGTIAPTHAAFIGATSTTTKIGYSNPPSHSSSITYTSTHSGSLIEDVDQMDMEELDIKWKMAMLSLRINKFQKKAGRKINFNNEDSARKWIRRHEHKPKEGEQVYGLMAGFKSDFVDPAVNATGSVYDVAVEFAMIGISPKAKIEKKETKLGLGFKEYFGLDEVFDLSTPSIFDPEPVTKEVKSLYERFVKAGDTHEVPPSIIGTFMPTYSHSVLEKLSDKSSKSETHDFASCVSSPMPADSFSTVDV